MLRIPGDDDPFLRAQAGRMFRLLTGVESYPAGVPIREDLLKDIQDLRSDACRDGINTIAVAEGCWGSTDAEPV